MALGIKNKTFNSICNLGIFVAVLMSFHMTASYLNFKIMAYGYDEHSLGKNLDIENDFDVFLKDNKYKKIILNELKICHKQKIDMFSIIEDALEKNKRDYLFNVFLWYIVAATFGFLRWKVKLVEGKS